MIYTKTGDKGTTSLVGGTRVPKFHPRVEAYGTVDELNAHIGLLAEMIKDTDGTQYGLLKEVQRNLFIVQTLLATEKEVPFQLPQLPDTAVADMEHSIDALQASLPPFRSFVIPGGNMASAQCHGQGGRGGQPAGVLHQPPVRLPLRPLAPPRALAGS